MRRARYAVATTWSKTSLGFALLKRADAGAAIRSWHTPTLESDAHLQHRPRRSARTRRALRRMPAGSPRSTPPPPRPNSARILATLGQQCRGISSRTRASGVQDAWKPPTPDPCCVGLREAGAVPHRAAARLLADSPMLEVARRRSSANRRCCTRRRSTLSCPRRRAVRATHRTRTHWSGATRDRHARVHDGGHRRGRHAANGSLEVVSDHTTNNSRWTSRCLTGPAVATFVGTTAGARRGDAVVPQPHTTSQRAPTTIPSPRHGRALYPAYDGPSPKVTSPRHLLRQTKAGSFLAVRSRQRHGHRGRARTRLSTHL